MLIRGNLLNVIQLTINLFDTEEVIYGGLSYKNDKKYLINLALNKNSTYALTRKYSKYFIIEVPGNTNPRILVPDDAKELVFKWYRQEF